MSWLRWLAVPDLHGNYTAWDDFRKAIKFKAEFKPHITVCLGDLFDLTALRAGASEGEQCDDLYEDLEAGFKALDMLRPNVLMFGNHDDRLFQIEQNPKAVIKAAAIQLIKEVKSRLKKIKCTAYPYDVESGVYEVGNLRFIHGYRAGITACRWHAFQYGGTVICGHIHSVEHAVIESRYRSECYSVGCMCEYERMWYARRRPAKLRWQRGFAYGVVHSKTGECKVFQATKNRSNDKWLLPGLIKEY